MKLSADGWFNNLQQLFVCLFVCSLGNQTESLDCHWTSACLHICKILLILNMILYESETEEKGIWILLRAKKMVTVFEMLPLKVV
jgi:hypothetical protein